MLSCIVPRIPYATLVAVGHVAYWTHWLLLRPGIKSTRQAMEAGKGWIDACSSQAFIVSLRSSCIADLHLPICGAFLHRDAANYTRGCPSCALSAGVCTVRVVLLMLYSPQTSLSSPIVQADAVSSPAPTCTRVILKQPSFKTVCTNYKTTVTFTSYTNCGGCALSTERLGLGLVC